MSLGRFYYLEREYRVLLKQIAKTMNVSDLAQLKSHRQKIVVEARLIVRQLAIAKPTWCGPN